MKFYSLFQPIHNRAMKQLKSDENLSIMTTTKQEQHPLS